MWKTLSVASLLCLSALSASAVPTPPDVPRPPMGPPPVAETCSDAGGVLFEIDHKVEDSPEMIVVETSELKLYEGGKWTFHSSNKRIASGCLSRSQMRTIADDLKHATWTGKTATAACAAVYIGYTQYASHGKVVWTQHVCQLEYLDDASRRSLTEIENILLTASAEHKPPCCKK
jgi:hypothetical protein